MRTNGDGERLQASNSAEGATGSEERGNGTTAVVPAKASKARPRKSSPPKSIAPKSMASKAAPKSISRKSVNWKAAQPVSPELVETEPSTDNVASKASPR